MFGEFVAYKIRKFNYVAVLKSHFNFQEKGENKAFFLGVISREIPINENVEILESNKNEEMSNRGAKDSQIQVENKEIEEYAESEKNVAIEIKEDNRETIENDGISFPLTTEVVQKNNLSESYNTIYQDIKIKNETNFNLSQEILIPNVEFKNKSDIIIFHTHTCESYTQTPENKYVASRELSNNRFELFCS